MSENLPLFGDLSTTWNLGAMTGGTVTAAWNLDEGGGPRCIGHPQTEQEGEVTEKGAVAVLEMYEDIGGWGISARGVRAWLKQLDDDVKTIELRIHSRGGSVFEAFPIAAMLAAHSARVVAVIEGVAFSAASYIAMSADHVQMNASALFMLHDAWAVTQGNIAEHEASIRLLSRIQPAIIDGYLRHSNWTREEIEAAMAANTGSGTFLNAEDALEAGFIHEIVEMPAPKAAVDLSGFEGCPPEAVARFADPEAAEVSEEAELLAEIWQHLTHQPELERAPSAKLDDHTIELIERYLSTH